MAFTVQDQEATNWCWAAVAASVGAISGKESRQFKIVEKEISGATNCDVNPGSSACNHAYYLDEAIKHLPRAINSQGALLLPKVKSELANHPGNPICVKIDWKNGGAHYVAIIGVTATDKLVIEDPKHGHQIPYTYNKFKAHYRKTGTWSETYLLR